MTDPQITQPLQGGTLNSVDGVTIVQSSGTISIPSSVPLPGSPTTTTQATSDSSTKLATTAYVKSVAVTNAANLTANAVVYGDDGAHGVKVAALNATATNKYLQQVSGAAPSMQQISIADCADYSETSWTPTDGSAAGLTLTIIVAKATKTGRFVNFDFELSYQVNSNGAAPKIAGYPFASGANDQYVGEGGAPIGTNAAKLQGGNGTTTSAILSASGSSAFTNTTMSGGTLLFHGGYRTW